MSYSVKTIIKRVTDFGRKPKTPAQVLQQAHDLLAQEGRWIKGDLFRDGDAQVAYEKASCGKWGVCSLGALGIVSGEMPVSVAKYNFAYDEPEYEWEPTVDVGADETPLAHRAAEYLAEAINPDFNPLAEKPYWIRDEAEDIVASYNDQKGIGRTRVLKAFQTAIEAAKGDPIAKARAK